ncbi:sporulation protein YpjB [Sediminibacillus massiliensis]|uniref:sporulation protein YpjB n=1 Tax=Sediminibacillus massiliensis TaxID=1926277 RepID=UPI0009885A5B|nr:sporulation protein YpjB [Sediminibacillus massiliensis]
MKKTGLLLLMSLIILIWNLFSNTEVAAHHSDIYSTVHQFTRLVQEGRHEDASRLLDEHRAELEKFIEEHSPWDKSEKLKELVDSTILTVENREKQNREKYSQALKLLLVMDTLQDDDKALLSSWTSDLRSEIASLQEDGNLTTEDMAKAAEYWEVIAPALELSIPQSDFEALSSAVSAGELAIDPEEENLASVTGQLHDLNFKQEDNIKKSITLLIMVVLVGGVIITTLSYVGFKKYKGEKDKVGNRSENS